MKYKWIVVICVVTLLVGCLAVGCTAKEEEPQEVIGIIGAMDVELDIIKAKTDVTKVSTYNDMEFCQGTLMGKSVVIVKCGMGKVNAGVCAYTLINTFGCTKIINTGVAGALDERLDIGDFVVSTEAVQHDFDVEHIGFVKGEIPYTGKVAFEADSELRAKAVAAVKASAPDRQVLEGRVCTGDQFIHTAEQKERITANFGGLCCEMEGGAVAQVCYLNATPFVIIRTVSDKVNETTALDYAVFERQAAAICAQAVLTMIQNM